MVLIGSSQLTNDKAPRSVAPIEARPVYCCFGAGFGGRPRPFLLAVGGGAG